MAINNEALLTGNLGNEATFHEDKKGNLFTAFSLATTDSYKDDKNEWKNREVVWHSILTYNSKLIQLMKSLKKGVRLEVKGGLIYKDTPHKIKGGKEIKLRQASILAWAITPKPLAVKHKTQTPDLAK